MKEELAEAVVINKLRPRGRQRRGRGTGPKVRVPKANHPLDTPKKMVWSELGPINDPGVGLREGTSGTFKSVKAY